MGSAHQFLYQNSHIPPVQDVGALPRDIPTRGIEMIDEVLLIAALIVGSILVLAGLLLAPTGLQIAVEVA